MFMHWVDRTGQSFFAAERLNVSRRGNAAFKTPPDLAQKSSYRTSWKIVVSEKVVAGTRIAGYTKWLDFSEVRARKATHLRMSRNVPELVTHSLSALLLLESAI